MRWLLVALGIGVLLGGAGLAATRLGDDGGRAPGRAREPEPAPPSVSGYPSLPTPGATPSSRVRPCEAGHLVARVSAPSVPTRAAPRPDARVIETFSQTTFLGGPRVFLVEDVVRGGAGGRWLEVLLPVRPNGTTGYVSARNVEVFGTDYRLTLDRAAFRLTLWEGCRKVRTFPVGLGTGDTPTPVGRFYLAYLLKPPRPDTVYGTYAYGLSAFSPVIKEWTGGGIIGLHGTNDPSSIGGSASHGCIRMRNADIEALVKLLPLGTPITIR